MTTTKRRDEPEVLIRPGPYTLVNQAEAIIQQQKKVDKSAATAQNIPKGEKNG